MTDLPRRPFTHLPPPLAGSADARRRGLLRRRRQQTTAGAGALAVVASVLSATVISTRPSAVDRLEPAPFATAPAASEGPAAESSTTPTPPAGEASAAPEARASDEPAATSPSEPPRQPAPVPQGTPQAAPAGQPAAGPAGPRLVRAYDPPTGNDATVCGGRITSGVGTPRAQTGWCVMADVQQQPGGTDFSVRVCRSSEAEASDLHVDQGAVLMRLEQDGAVLWRLPPVDEPAAVLRTEPAGCWSWSWTWDGRGNDGTPVPSGASVLHVNALADEVRDFEEQEQFTHEG